MSPTVVAQSAPRTHAPGSNRPHSHWLVGPWFDLVFIANLLWPLLLLVPFREGFDGRAGVQFWQLYFITTPHRWITLLLVFGDRPRFRERRGAFLGILLAVAAICITVRSATGALTCLLAVDYVWNAWHFAAQHHGIYRIYGRLGDPGGTRGLLFEKWGLRLFLLYVILRVAGATWGHPNLESALRSADLAVLALPVLLVGQSLARKPARTPGGFVYLVSTLGLYLSLLWAVHAQRPALVLTLATASALFHAIEYLALVGWAAKQRAVRAGDELGLLGWLVPRWGVALGLYVVALGSVGWLMDRHLLEFWLLLNVIVAFLHYSYDALIWRRAKPSAATTAPAMSTGGES